MSNDTSFLLLEASDSDCCLCMTHVDESNDSLISLGEVSLTEETIVVDDCCAFIDNAKGFQASDLCRVDKSLALNVGSIRGDSKDYILCCYLIPHVEFVEFAEVEGQYLLNCESVSIATLCTLKGDFVILHRSNFVSYISLLELELCLTLYIEAEEACREQY